MSRTFGERPVEQDLLARYDIDGNNMQRNRQLLKPLAPDVIADEAPQARTGHEVGTCPEEAERAAEGVEGKDLAAPYVAPDGGELVGRLHARRAGRDECPDDRPDGGATIKSGAMARSGRARSIPTWIGPSPAPPETANATGDDFWAMVVERDPAPKSYVDAAG